jgi:ribosomal protein S18 acetylase RimI-like enzyme
LRPEDFQSALETFQTNRLKGAIMGEIIERLDSSQWEVFRDLRLAALAESPTAFWSNHADEAAYGQHDWAAFVNAATWLVAWTATADLVHSRHSGPNGILGLLRRPELPAEPEIIGMWVAPPARRHGLGGRLLDEASTRAAADGARGLTLWVLEHNDGAARLYRRHEFHFTGEQMTLPRDPGVIELRMRKVLGAGRPAGSTHPTDRLFPPGQTCE